MKRFLALSILWLVATVAHAAPWGSGCIQTITAGQTVSGTLTTSDCRWFFTSTPGQVYYTDVYAFSGVAGQQISVSMSSTNLDPFLQIYNVNEINTSAIVSDDDGGGGLNARIPAGSGFYTLPATGTYYLWADTAVANQTGSYTLTLSSLSATPPPIGQVTITEFYHPGFNHYFITGYAAEAASLIAGNLPPWIPTGQTFVVWDSAGAGITNVCRFFSATFAPKSSHFYSHNPAECPVLATGGVWGLESLNAFYMMPTATGNCPLGTVPLYRLYNNGLSGAPNHRYTAQLSIRATMISQGWVPEGNGPNGVFACVISGSSSPPPAGSAFQQEVTGYANTILGLFNGDVFNPSQLSLVLQSAVTAVTTPGSTCPVATSNPSLQGATTIPPNVTINVSYGAGCTPPGTGTSISGGAVITLTNFTVTDTGVAGNVLATFDNVKVNGTLVAHGGIQATLNLTINASTSAVSGPVSITLNNLQLATLAVRGNVSLNLNSAGTSTVTTNLTTSPDNVAINLALAVVPQADGSSLVNSNGPSTVGAYTLQVTNLRINTSVCATGPVGGSFAFTKAGQTGTLTFDSSCGYTYSGP